MRKVSISALKARLSAYLRAVRNGEEVLVTDRGRPVARLTPLDQTEHHEARIAELIQAGLARPPAGRLPKDFWDRPRPRDPDGLILKALLEERERGR